jgi:TetR/AcrR family transcriptional repressor of nem operon
MKVSREQAAASRERILEAGTRLFRERGFDGIGVADLMREAGLTHGGFYGHFASKEELMAKACERALAKSAAKWEGLLACGRHEALASMADSYLPRVIATTRAPVASCRRRRRVARHGAPCGAPSHRAFVAPRHSGSGDAWRTRVARREQALVTFASMVARWCWRERWTIRNCRYKSSKRCGTRSRPDAEDTRQSGCSRRPARGHQQNRAAGT